MIQTNEINQLVKGKIIAEGNDCTIDNLLIDSRKIAYPASSIFIPIVSERRNAHQYIEQVYNAGVRCFLVSEEIKNLATYKDAWFIEVKNTVLAMQQIVAWYRSKFSFPIMGITGSNGKTIVKEWLYQLLENDYKIVRSPKSFNSQIGVPLSVWQINEEHNLGIFEAGISQSDEMEWLEKIIKPNIGIFTNIGETHNEGFLNIKHKVNEKLKLFQYSDVLIYNKDYAVLHECILQFASNIKQNQEREIKLLTWSKKIDADLLIHDSVKENYQTTLKATFNQQAIEITIPFTDDAYIEDSIHCWLMMLHLNIDQSIIQERMSKLSHIAMRLELMKGINNCTLINDSYNSDVSSFTIALDFLLQQNQHEEKTVILSDIFQSGRENELYDEVADLLKQKKIQKFIGIGETLTRNKAIFRSNRKLQSTFYKTTEAFLEDMDTSSFNNESILIKGARKFEFEKIAKRLQERIHQTVVEINLNNLLENYKLFQSLLKPTTQIMAMVKAFSYGSGSFEIANKLQFEGVSYLAVAYSDEGMALRKAGIKLPIMVMNADENSFSQLIEWNLEPEIYNFRILQKMIEALQESSSINFPIHIKLDTGMHRLGFEEEDISPLIEMLKIQPEVKVVSVFSHLAGSEDATLDDFTNHQSNHFLTMSDQLQKGLGYSFIKHLCNSSGIVRHPELQFDMVRLGLGLYGIDGSKSLKSKLKNVSRMKTIISQIKKVSVNETVGYNRKGILKRDTIIGTVSVGYADGISRKLGNGIGKMFLNGQLVPIVGNVCMDMCMLDITDVANAKEGDTVIIFGEELPVENIAKWADTIPYEILTGISQRVKRVYFEE
jgi:Alr-MurF fusion protein